MDNFKICIKYRLSTILRWGPGYVVPSILQTQHLALTDLDDLALRTASMSAGGAEAEWLRAIWFLKGYTSSGTFLPVLVHLLGRHSSVNFFFFFLVTCRDHFIGSFYFTPIYCSTESHGSSHPISSYGNPHCLGTVPDAHLPVCCSGPTMLLLPSMSSPYIMFWSTHGLLTPPIFSKWYFWSAILVSLFSFLWIRKIMCVLNPPSVHKHSSSDSWCKNYFQKHENRLGDDVQCSLSPQLKGEKRQNHRIV